jgi:predicted benzoate:H+ symporter BenE
MALDTLRMIVGFLIIVSHLTTFGLVLLAGGLTAQERVELSLLISPIFAVYVAAIVRKFTSLTVYDTTPTHPALAILGVGTAVIFSVAIPVTILLFVNQTIPEFAVLKSTIGIIETALGLYTGALIDRLFGTPASNRARATARSGKPVPLQ